MTSDSAGEDRSLRVPRVAASLRDQVKAALKAAMLQGRFRPGERLVERELIALTGVSRTSVREALRLLEAEGFVQVLPDKGPIVATLGEQELRHIAEVRAILFAQAARRFATGATSEQRAALREAIARYEATLDDADGERAFVAINEVYARLFAGAQNPLLGELALRLIDRIALVRRVSFRSGPRPKAALAGLTAVLLAIERNDAGAAEELMLGHLQNGTEALVAAARAEGALLRAEDA